MQRLSLGTGSVWAHQWAGLSRGFGMLKVPEEQESCCCTGGGAGPDQRSMRWSDQEGDPRGKVGRGSRARGRGQGLSGAVALRPSEQAPERMGLAVPGLLLLGWEQQSGRGRGGAAVCRATRELLET